MASVECTLQLFWIGRFEYVIPLLDTTPRYVTGFFQAILPLSQNSIGRLFLLEKKDSDCNSSRVFNRATNSGQRGGGSVKELLRAVIIREWVGMSAENVLNKLEERRKLYETPSVISRVPENLVPEENN